MEPLSNPRSPGNLFPGTATYDAGATLPDPLAPDGKVHLLADGWCAEFHQLEDGRRQIVRFILPGDVVGLRCLVLGGRPGHCMALTSVLARTVSVRAYYDDLAGDPERIRGLVAAARDEEWELTRQLVHLGRYDAMRRVAALLAGLHRRLERVGLARNDRFPLPLTQETLADATGLSAVHMNRTLRALRDSGCIGMKDGTVSLRDPAALARVAGEADWPAAEDTPTGPGLMQHMFAP